jgi:hypothetical protein
MRQLTLTLFTGFVFNLSLSAQVGIGTTSPASSAKLEVAATDKGFLPPRLALTNSTSNSPIASTPETGLLIFNTATTGDVTPGYYFWSGTAWKRLISPSEDNYPISVSNGGTGSTSLTANRVLLGNGTSALQTVAPGTSGNVLTSNGTTWTSAAPAAPTTFSSDITVNGIRIGRGVGNIAGNTALGRNTLYSNTSGFYNTSVGDGAGFYNTDGDYNTTVGAAAGQNINTGNQNTILGSFADVPVLNGNIVNATAIGYFATVNESNTIRLGNTQITKLITQGKLVSGDVTYPNTDGTNAQVLTTNGSGTASWQNVSTAGTVEIGGGNYGVTYLASGGNFTADWTNSKLNYMRVGNMVFYNAIIGKFTTNANQQVTFEFKPPIASAFTNTYDAIGTITAYSASSNTVISGRVRANTAYNSSTQSYNLVNSFIVANAAVTDVYVSISGSYIVR